jgi:hypothetical protein
MVEEVSNSCDNLLDGKKKKEPGAAMEEGISALARFKSCLTLSLLIIYVLPISYHFFMPVMS